MLRPATPLAVLLFAAFALLLISVLSTPIIQVIPLGTSDGTNFGVFGFCKDDVCSPIEIGYDQSQIASPDDAGTFDLPSSTRATLSAILVVHPIAAFFTLVMFVLAIVAHFHSPSHSARYLLAVFIVSLVDFLLCLLAFLIDVLLFVPHLAWGSYIVLAATILVAFSSLVSCAMRRTVVGRKAQKKRIAENAEMSGENFFNRQAQQAPVAPAASIHPTVPVLSGANGGAGGGDNLPEFAAFEKKDDRSSDEREPLTAHSPPQRSPHNIASDLASNPADMPPNGPAGFNPPHRSNSSPPVQFDQYGNPIPGPDGYGMRRGPSSERMNSRGRGGMPPGYRGRGGYSPGPGRGGYNGYGPPPNGRGGYGSPQRGGYGPPPGGRGGYGPPPRGYGGPGMRGGRPPPPGYQNGPGPYDRRGSPSVGYPGPYGRQPSPGPVSAPGYMNPSNANMAAGSYEAYNPGRGSLPRAESPPPLPAANDAPQSGQAVELDAATRGPSPPPQGYGQFGIRESDHDVAGMLALQQGGATAPRGRDTYTSDDSRYSQEEGAYVPPRQAWNQGVGRNSPGMPSPLNLPGRSAELPSRSSPGPQQPPPAGEYYEDVDPRFAEPSTAQRPTPPPIQTTNTYEDIPQGERSPAESERSTFTSISQRGVNPRWNPPPQPPMAQGFGQHLIPPRRQMNANDVLLKSNPDFELPAARNNQPRTGAGMIPGSAYPTGPL